MNRLTKLDRNVYHPTPTGAQFLEPDDGSNAARLLQNIGKYEDIEEEMGCPIETLTKAIKNGIWIIPPHSEKRIPMFVRHPYLTFDENINKEGEMENKPLFFFMYRFDEYICNSGYYFLEDCGKTWALTKEGLKNGQRIAISR